MNEDSGPASESEILGARLPSSPPHPIPEDARIPADKRERFREVAMMLEQFGQARLDPELTAFTQELWRRVLPSANERLPPWQTCHWAATVVHVIARMNFLFDRGQPVHLRFDTICRWFQASKTTVGGKATELERALRLRQHSEPGLCRPEFIDDFEFVQLPNGVVMSLGMAKEMGLVPPDARR